MNRNNCRLLVLGTFFRYSLQLKDQEPVVFDSTTYNQIDMTRKQKGQRYLHFNFSTFYHVISHRKATSKTNKLDPTNGQRRLPILSKAGWRTVDVLTNDGVSIEHDAAHIKLW
ncbi:MAG: hypothetical protein CL912_27675 [Deltaproteobacteria bacterium]|nr:hypothetical protein [Deltaproteobacteria bacterium]